MEIFLQNCDYVQTSLDSLRNSKKKNMRRRHWIQIDHRLYHQPCLNVCERSECVVWAGLANRSILCFSGYWNKGYWLQNVLLQRVSTAKCIATKGIATKAIDNKMCCYKGYRQLNVLLQRVSLQRVSTTHWDFSSNQINAIFCVCCRYPLWAIPFFCWYPL